MSGVTLLEHVADQLSFVMAKPDGSLLVLWHCTSVRTAGAPASPIGWRSKVKVKFGCGGGISVMLPSGGLGPTESSSDMPASPLVEQVRTIAPMASGNWSIGSRNSTVSPGRRLAFSGASTCTSVETRLSRTISRRAIALAQSSVWMNWYSFSSSFPPTMPEIVNVASGICRSGRRGPDAL